MVIFQFNLLSKCNSIEAVYSILFIRPFYVTLYYIILCDEKIKISIFVIIALGILIVFGIGTYFMFRLDEIPSRCTYHWAFKVPFPRYAQLYAKYE